MGDAVQRSDCHQSNDGGAVGVGDDAPLAAADLDVGHVLGVDLWDDERDALGHAEGRAVVNNLCSTYMSFLMAPFPFGNTKNMSDAVFFYNEHSPLSQQQLRLGQASC